MRKPRWIAALLLALAVAAGFAALGQWQLGHAVSQNVEERFDTEQVVALDTFAGPGKPVTDESAARMATISGSFVPGDSRVVSTRMNQGKQGYWVVGHLVTDDEPRAHLAVAIGWAATEKEAERALKEIDADPAFAADQPVVGRYMPAEGSATPDGEADPFEITSIAPAQLVNLWQPFAGLSYPGFLVAEQPMAGLTVIDSVPPLPQDSINWLNVFYAVEWVVFAGFALFFWYRLTKDAWEKELQLLDEAEGEPETTPETEPGTEPGTEPETEPETLPDTQPEPSGQKAG